MEPCPSSPPLPGDWSRLPVVQANLNHHIFVCTGATCTKQDSQAVLEAFWKELAHTGQLYGKRGSQQGGIIVSSCGSVGLCGAGPAVLVYPQGIWYAGVTPQDVPEIIQALNHQTCVTRLLAVTIKT